MRKGSVGEKVTRGALEDTDLEKGVYAVVGGGLVGCTAALILGRLGEDVKMWDPCFAKPLATDYPLSLRVDQKQRLEQLGVWSRLAEHVWPISSVSLRCEAREVLKICHINSTQPTLAWGCMASTLMQALQAELSECDRVFVCAEAVESLTQAHTSGSQEQWLVKTNQGAEHRVQRVLLADGLRSPTAQRLGLEFDDGPWVWESCVFLLSEAHDVLDTAWQSLVSDRVYGVIPGKARGDAWLVASAPGEGRFSAMDKEQRVDYVQSDLKSMGQSWQIVSGGESVKKAALAKRSRSLWPGLLCVGQARCAFPAVGAQSLNRSWDELWAFWGLQRRLKWHTVSGLEWQKTIEDSWDQRLSDCFFAYKWGLRAYAAQPKLAQALVEGVCQCSVFSNAVEKALLHVGGVCTA